ncbi:MAG: CPBP family intramembrane metalloprotease [Oscillospiraceae bacterium]|jgi:membrane protease YdiL (CAAX protease family)|nr:CPBP family intramembrane metalloprotease [Oscillospiraceae bacterium]
MNYYNQNSPGGPRAPTPYQAPPQNRKDPIKKALRKNANIIGFGMLLQYGLSIVVVFAISLLVGIFFYGRMTQDGYYIYENILSLIAYTAGFVVPIIIMVVWIRIPKDIAFPMKPPKMSLLIPGIFFCLGMSIVGVYLSDFLSRVIQLVFGLTPTMPDMSAPEQPVSIFVYCINLIIAPAFLEEMMFRGVIMQSLRRFGDGFALVVSSILFAMAHGNLVQGPNTLIMGLVMGYMVLRTGSLWTGIIIHFINNGVAVLLELTMRFTTPEQDQMINTVMLAVYVLGGLISLAYLMMKNNNMFRIAPSPLPMSEGKKHLYFFTSIMPIILLAVTVFITSQYLVP